MLLGLHGDARDLRRGSLEPVLGSPRPHLPEFTTTPVANGAMIPSDARSSIQNSNCDRAKSALGIQALALLIGQSQEVGTVTVPMSQLGCVTGEVTCLHAEL